MMGVIETLTLAMGTAWTSGINLYATVAALGLAMNAGLINLPPELQVLGNPVVIGIASVMYAIEFFTDKVPYVDNGWDVLHTFIRIPAGALLAAGAVGEVSQALELSAFLAGGTIAGAAHVTKATARLAVNISPEPISNIVASVGEDVVVVGSLWLIFQHPLVMLGVLVIFAIFAAWFIPKMFSLAKRGFQSLRAKWRGEPPVSGTVVEPS
jgi:hypothetical protein